MDESQSVILFAYDCN